MVKSAKIIFVIALFSALSALSFEARLDEFIATMSGLKPGILKGPDALEKLSTINFGDVPPIRMQRTRQILESLGGYQFPPELAVRELVANGLDSYYYDTQLAQSLSPSSKRVAVFADNTQGTLAVAENGVGMDLDQIAFYLLAPTRSTNPAILAPGSSMSGVTGRFGQGFFSVLSFLKTNNDRVFVLTKAENGQRFDVTLSKRDGEYRVQIERSDENIPRGTTVWIVADELKSLTKGANYLVHVVIPEYFRYNNRGSIDVDGAPINQFANLKTINANASGSGTENILFTDGRIVDGTGKVSLLVNGILIRAFNFTGANIYGELAIDLPSTTELSSDRTTINFKNQTTAAQIAAIAKYAFENDPVLFNSIYPLLGKDYFAEGPNLMLWPTAQMIPAVDALQKIISINGKSALRMHPQFIDDRGIRLVSSLPGSLRLDEKILVIPSQFSDEESRAQIQRIKEKTLVFIKDDLDIGNKTTLPLINILDGITNKKLGYGQRSALFTYFDLKKLQRSEATPSLPAENTMLVASPPQNADVDEERRQFRSDFSDYENILTKYGDKIFDLVYQISSDYSHLYNKDLTRKTMRDFLFELFLNFSNSEDNARFLDELVQGGRGLENLIAPLKNVAENIIFQSQIGRTALTTLSEGLGTRNTLADLLNGQAAAYLQRLREYSEKITKHLTVKTYGTPRDVRDMEFDSAIVDICEENNLNRCADVVVFRSQELHYHFNDQKLDEKKSEVAAYLKYLISLGFSENNFDELWATFEKKNILSDDALMADVDTILTTKKFYFEFCAQWPGDIAKNCLEVLPNLLQEMLKDNELKASVERFANFLPEAAKGSKRLSVDERFSALEKTVHPQLLYSYIFPIFYGSKTSFYETSANYSGEGLRNLLPVKSYSSIREIIGADSDVINKEYRSAIFNQNFQPYAWVREIIKNAVEAGSPDLEVKVNTNTTRNLLVTLRDHGEGISADNMHYLYVPKITSKARDEEDINMGWGFFTIFKDFDDVFVETSQDGKTKNILRLLKDSDESMYIAEQYSVVDESFARGTKISMMRLDKPARGFEPSAIKGNVMRFLSGELSLKLYFNDELLNTPRAVDVMGPELVPPLVVGPNQTIRFNAHPIGGVFYKGLMQTSSLMNYTSALPTELQTLVDKLPERLAISFIGSWKQNTGRTGFLAEEEFKDVITRRVHEAYFLQMANAFARNPSLFTSILPYDYFYEFRDGADHARTTKMIMKRVYDSDKPLTTILTSTGDMAAYMLSLPIKPQLSPILHLKSSIRRVLQNHGVVSATGKYVDDAATKMKPGLFNSLLGDHREFLPILKKFESEIFKEISISEQMGHDMDGQHDDTPFDQLPAAYDQQKPALAKLTQLLVITAEHLLDEKIEIWFYDKADASGAHSLQGQTGETLRIAFNIKSGLVQEFVRMHGDAKKVWHHNLYLRLLEDVTHELVHCRESIDEASHDRAFFTKHEKLLQRVFLLTDQDIENLTKMLW